MRPLSQMDCPRRSSRKTAKFWRWRNAGFGDGLYLVGTGYEAHTFRQIYEKPMLL